MLNEPVVAVKRITDALGIHGWGHLDAVILASLATESPMLLIGPHGTAKSLLVELLSKVLDYNFRHYNASLLNYDDLVGIPLPEEGNDRLHFVSTPSAIWDAEFVFFDEISRCRPDLQNKLFPIIHERKIVGIPLEKLHHRWAAMNPPVPDEPDLSNAASTDKSYYLGSEPLDPALVDRFPFIAMVPNWRDLSREDRRKLISLADSGQDRDKEWPPDRFFPELIAACQDRMPSIEEEYAEWLTDYMIGVMDLLEQAKLPQSPRRARQLAHSIIAIHAARLVLEGDDAEISDSAETALLYGLPQTATDVPPAESTVVAVHKQAWEISIMMDNEAWRRILEEPDLIQRVLLGQDMELSDEDMSRLITQALSSDESDARKISLATAMFLHFRKDRVLTPAAWEFLVKLANKVLEPRMLSFVLPPNSNDKRMWDEIEAWAGKYFEEGDNKKLLEVNFVVAGFPELWRRYNWRDALDQFKRDLEMFGVGEIE